ncbi:MAG: transcription elongation factor GreA [Lachnospirales bacterium]
MDNKKVVLTSEGLRKLEEEFHDLKINKRKEVAEKIKEARAQGDLSENAEYDSAKDEQAEIEARIAEIEAMLRNAEVIAEDTVDRERASLGGTVKIYDEKYKIEETFTIVGSAEADPLNNKISNESPIGIAVIGNKVGDTVVARTPEGNINIKILEVVSK